MGAAAILRMNFPMSVNELRQPRGNRLISTAEYRAWQQEQLWFIRQENKGEPTVHGAYTMHMMLNRPDNRRRDCTNYIKSAEDLVAAAGFIDGDYLCQKFTIEWVRGQSVPLKTFIVSTVER
jgi:Holliday junction resolvase RusA-like endonuclease